MLKDRIIELLETKTDTNKDHKRLIASLLEFEQKYISYELRTNDLRLKEIKQKIRDEIDLIITVKPS